MKFEDKRYIVWLLTAHRWNYGGNEGHFGKKLIMLGAGKAVILAIQDHGTPMNFWDNLGNLGSILNPWHNFKIFVNILENHENYTHKHADLLHVLHFPDPFRLMFLASFVLHFSEFFGCICFKNLCFWLFWALSETFSVCFFVLRTPGHYF